MSLRRVLARCILPLARIKHFSARFRVAEAIDCPRGAAGACLVFRGVVYWLVSVIHRCISFWLRRLVHRENIMRFCFAMSSTICKL